MGIASNQLVLIANQDTFPVMLNAKKTAEYLKVEEKVATKEKNPDNWKMPALVKNDAVMIDDVHCIMTSHTRLNFLADIFDFKTAIYSVGDGLIELGEWLFGFCPFIWLFDVARKLKDQKE
jgi:hypothetical protein